LKDLPHLPLLLLLLLQAHPRPPLLLLLRWQRLHFQVRLLCHHLITAATCSNMQQLVESKVKWQP
jgi:hypothetical protein